MQKLCNLLHNIVSYAALPKSKFFFSLSNNSLFYLLNQHLTCFDGKYVDAAS